MTILYFGFTNRRQNPGPDGLKELRNSSKLMTSCLLAGQCPTKSCCSVHGSSQTLLISPKFFNTRPFSRGQHPSSKTLKCKNGTQLAGEVVQKGDTATIHFTAYGEQGKRLESTRDAGQALNFEVGSSTAVGNDLLQIFDEGIIGMRVGETLQLHVQFRPAVYSQRLTIHIFDCSVIVSISLVGRVYSYFKLSGLQLQVNRCAWKMSSL